MIDAFNGNRLTAQQFSAFAALPTQSAFEDATATLLPLNSDAGLREVLENQNAFNRLVADRSEANDRGVWVQVALRSAEFEGDSRFASLSLYEADSRSVSLGADIPVNQTGFLGAAFGYSRVDIDFDGAAPGSTKVESFTLGAYGGFQSGGITAVADASYLFGNSDFSRETFLGRAQGENEYSGFNLSGKVSYAISVNETFSILPKAGLNYARISEDDYRENGGLNLGVAASTAEFFEGEIGAAVRGTFRTAMGGFQLRGRAMYVRAFEDDPRTYALAFSASSTPILLQGLNRPDDRMEYGAGLRFTIYSGATIDLDYEREDGDNYTSNSGLVRLRLTF